MTGFNNPLGAVSATLDAGSAAAIGTATATDANTLGIPNTLIQDVLYSGGFTNVGPGNDTGWLLVAKYSSLVLQSDIVVGNNQFTYSFSNDAAVTSYLDYFTGQKNQQIPVRGKWFKIHNNLATAAHLTILGTNRHLSSARDQVFSGSNLPGIWGFASTAFTAGSISQFPALSAARSLTGKCFLAASLSSGTAARGIINYVYVDEGFNSQSFPLTDTGEWHLDWPSGALFVYKEVILPNMVGFTLNFQCRVAGTTAITLTLVSDSQ